MSEENWDFYYCQVDDAPASIFFNLDFGHTRPPLSTRYFVGLQILEPGEHGIGAPSDAEALWALEDCITDAVTERGLVYVGRLRNRGDWQMTFYGESGKEEALEAAVVAALGDQKRGYRYGSEEDPSWRYFREFMWPDAERWQWIMDRRVVQQLQEHGDRLDVPRPVDHFVHFADAGQRAAFMTAAKELGFAVSESEPHEESEHPFGTALVREDPAELDHIHQVVMVLKRLSETHEGDYDGWGCPIAQ